LEHLLKEGDFPFGRHSGRAHSLISPTIQGQFVAGSLKPPTKRNEPHPPNATLPEQNAVKVADLTSLKH